MAKTPADLWMKQAHEFAVEVNRLRARLAEVEAVIAECGCQTEAGWAEHDRVRALEARLAEVEAGLASEAEAHRHSAAGRAVAEARLAEVEAERDALRAGLFGAHQDQETAEARLAEVEALCDDERNYGFTVSIDDVRAAAQGEGNAKLAGNSGEGDRPAEQMLADVQREHAAAWADQNRPNLGPVQCNHSPEWYAGLTWCNICQPRCAANGCTNRATSTRKSAVPGWPDELACGQHGREGDRPIPERFLRGEGER